MSSDARRWADGWKRAWEEHDAEAIAALYAEDAVDYSAPFRAPNVGREGVLAYARWAFASEAEQQVWFGEPLEQGDRGWSSGGRRGSTRAASPLSPAARCFVSDPTGLVTEARNYWHEEDGRRSRPEGWGG